MFSRTSHEDAGRAVLALAESRSHTDENEPKHGACNCDD